MTGQRPPARDPLVDWAAVRDWSALVLHAPRRHKLLSAAVLVAIAGLGGSSPWLLPRTWHVEATLLAQRNQVMPALGNPLRSMPSDADAPTRAATEIVLRRSNLVALVGQASLLELWSASRAPLARWKDRLVERVAGPADAEERLDAMVGLLERRLRVQVNDGTVTLAIDWHDGPQAFRIIDSAQQNFLEARHAYELSTIAETISILEGHASDVRDAVVTAVSDLTRAQQVRPGEGKPRAATAPPPPRAPSAAEQERAQIRVLLGAKRRAIADLEDFRRRRLAELLAQVDQQRATYSELHPSMQGLRESIAALERESPQIASLREEAAQIAAQYTRVGGTLSEAGEPTEPLPLRRPPEPEVTIVRTAGEPEDAALEYARARLRFAVGKYESLLDRIDAARIELETARAAFKYRYSVVRPAQVPRRPLKPSVPRTMALALLAAIAGAFAAAGARDLASRRLVERWQVERQLHLALAGDEVVRKKWTALAVVPAGPQQSVLPLCRELFSAAALEEGRAAALLSGEPLDRARGTAIAAEIQAVHSRASGASDPRDKLIVALDSPRVNPLAAGVLASCDAVLLAAELGQSSLDAARETIALIGRERIVGCALVGRGARPGGGP